MVEIKVKSHQWSSSKIAPSVSFFPSVEGNKSSIIDSVLFYIRHNNIQDMMEWDLNVFRRQHIVIMTE